MSLWIVRRSSVAVSDTRLSDTCQSRGERGMSVTAAKGFVASGVEAGIKYTARRISPSCARCRTRPARRCSRATACRPPASRSRASTSRSPTRRPSSSTPGYANAATGERGKLDALASAAEAARLLELDAEEVLVLSTGVIGARLPLHRLLPALEPAVAALSPDGGADAAAAIMTTDTRAEGGGRRARRLHGRRHGEGLRDDPPRPRHDARGRHDRLPARARRGDRVPPARRSRRASTRSRSTASRPRTTA